MGLSDREEGEIQDNASKSSFHSADPFPFRSQFAGAVRPVKLRQIRERLSAPASIAPCFSPQQNKTTSISANVPSCPSEPRSLCSHWVCCLPVSLSHSSVKSPKWIYVTCHESHFSLQAVNLCISTPDFNTARCFLTKRSLNLWTRFSVARCYFDEA